MAAIISLATSALNGTSILTQQQRSDGPFKGGQVSQVGQITVAAGTAQTLVLTVQNLLDYPIINLIPAGQNANHNITLPDPTTCAGVKTRVVRTGPIIANTWTFQPAAGTVAGGFVLLASAVGIVPTHTKVSFTATATPGDYIEFTSSGVYWSVSGASGAAAGIAEAA